MNRYKYLIKNIGLLTLSSFATKLLSFFLVPLYTNILTTTEYGTYDLFQTTVGVLLPILTLNIQESVMRFVLDKKYSRKAILSVGIKYLLSANLMLCFGLVVNTMFGFSAMVKEYVLFFFLMFFMNSLSGIVLAYIRGTDHITDLSVSSVIASFFTICFNIVFLVIFKWGLVGYFWANILGPFLQCLYLIIRTGMIREINLKEDFSQEKKVMLDYCRPMIANSIAWWVNNASDRYVVIFFCGLAENGIYSVASKIPSILNIFQSIFNQAWTLSAVRDFDSEDKNGFFTNTYKIYNCLMVVVCSAVILADKILAKFLYAKDFYTAWKYVPWLTIAIVFGALSGHIGGIFSAAKDSKIFAQSTVIGAVSNIFLNLLFTPLFGALGAAVSTAVSYVLVWAVRLSHSRRYIKLNINLSRDIITYIILVAQAVILLADESAFVFAIEAAMFGVICMFYLKDIIDLSRKREKLF